MNSGWSKLSVCMDSPIEASSRAVTASIFFVSLFFVVHSAGVVGGGRGVQRYVPVYHVCAHSAHFTNV